METSKKFKPLLAVDTCDITEFIRINKFKDLPGFNVDVKYGYIGWNESGDILSQEMNHIQDKLPNQIRMEDELA